MSNVAVFVDAGYLFAQGSALIAGAQRSRAEVMLNETAAMAELTAVASTKATGVPLLRVYWYDAARSGHGLTLDHATLAHTDYVKLRLGFINSQRQQKGVDSLIVTDLIELARNRAIRDAVLLSGDEDVRIGVQIAQSFGVRVHLLGIKPSRGSQSLQLLQEADTTTEWDNQTVSRFLTVRSTSIAVHPGSVSNSLQPGSAPFDAVIMQLASDLDSTEVGQLNLFWQTQQGLPPEIDGRLIARCRTELGRNLDPSEKREVRRRFIASIKTGKT